MKRSKKFKLDKEAINKIDSEYDDRDLSNYTNYEVKTLYEHLKDEPMKYQVYLLLAIYSGFRRSEMLGLEWKDICHHPE